MTQPKSEWLFYAVASGGCAALNGVFAKLTTTGLTTAWATGISDAFGMSDQSVYVEYLIRGSFFLANLAFNAVMWSLFTRALTSASSTVRVSVINTSANFMLTALLGALVFGENLPALWWLGASMLVVGSVIIGRRDEGNADAAVGSDDNVKAKKSDIPSNEATRNNSGVSVTGSQAFLNPSHSQARPRLQASETHE